MRDQASSEQSITNWAPWPSRALIIAERGAAAWASRTALENAGLRPIGPVGFCDAVAEIHRCSAEVILVDAAGVDADTLESVLDALTQTGRLDEEGVLVLTPLALLDLGAAHCLGGPALMLCEPDADDLADAIRSALRRPTHLDDRSEDRGRLAELADQALRLAQGLNAYVASPSAPKRDGVEHDAAAAVRSTIRARRLRDQHFRPGLFADPAWDILLDLFAAHLEKRRITVSSLCVAAAVPATTALRWITLLVEHGILIRAADSQDRRRVYVSLSDAGFEGMTRYAAAIHHANLNLA